MDWIAWVGIVGTLATLGGLIYAVQSGKKLEKAATEQLAAAAELRSETDVVKRTTRMILDVMADAGWVEVQYDANGYPVRIVRLSGTAAGTSSLTGDLTVTHNPPPSVDGAG